MKEKSASESETQKPETTAASDEERDEDEATVEDVPELEDDVDEEEKPVKTKSVIVDEWIHLNSQPPIWMRLVYYLPVCHLLTHCVPVM